MLLLLLLLSKRCFNKLGNLSKKALFVLREIGYTWHTLTLFHDNNVMGRESLQQQQQQQQQHS